MKNPLVVSAGLFTVVPLPPTMEIPRDLTRRAIAWFPVVGLLLGAVAGCVGTLVLFLSGNSLLAAALAVATMQLLTGVMHTDGLADTADGLAALGSMKDGRDAERALAIMHQPDTGAMGVVTVVLTLLCQVAAISTATSPWQILALTILSAVAARVAVVVATRASIPPVHKGGFGALFAGCTRPATIILWLVLLVAACFTTFTLPAALAAAIAVLVAQGAAVMWSARLVRRFGGLSGDMYGAINELTFASTAILLALCL